MSGFVVAGDRRVLLTHMAFYGLAAILADAGVEDLTMRWDHRSRARVEGSGIDSTSVDDVVRAHAGAHTADTSWVTRDENIDGGRRGLMSPRLTPFKGDQTWQEVQSRRREVLDGLTVAGSLLDLRELAALGEPCYWSFTAKGEPLQDDGASRFEMQPRNRGSEIVTNRLRPLAANVASRAPGRIVGGLDGTDAVDELSRGAADAVTATGLTVPGPVDNAVAWCALWGISSFPLAHRVNGTAVTSGHFGRPHREWFYVPAWSGSWRPARLRSILVSTQLRTAASTGMRYWSPGTAREVSARAWLDARGVVGLHRFEIRRFGSDNAPERRALYGEPVRVGGAR